MRSFTHRNRHHLLVLWPLLILTPRSVLAPPPESQATTAAAEQRSGFLPEVPATPTLSERVDAILNEGFARSSGSESLLSRLIRRFGTAFGELPEEEHSKFISLLADRCQARWTPESTDNGSEGTRHVLLALSSSLYARKVALTQELQGGERDKMEEKLRRQITEAAKIIKQAGWHTRFEGQIRPDPPEPSKPQKNGIKFGNIRSDAKFMREILNEMERATFAPWHPVRDFCAKQLARASGWFRIQRKKTEPSLF